MRVNRELDRWLAEVDEQVQRSPEDVADQTRARARELYRERLSPEQDLAEWVATVWQPWANRAKVAVAARALYERLYALHLRAERDEATHEVVWGRALLSWAPPEAPRIRTPILTVPATIDIDSDTGAITVAPERAMELELDAVEGLDLPGVEEFASLRNRLREAPPDPWSSAVVDEVRRGFSAPLGLNAALAEGTDVPAPGPHPAVNDGWVLFIRPRPVMPLPTNPENAPHRPAEGPGRRGVGFREPAPEPDRGPHQRAHCPAPHRPGARGVLHARSID